MCRHGRSGQRQRAGGHTLPAISAGCTAEFYEPAHHQEYTEHDGEDVPATQAITDCVNGVGHDDEQPGEQSPRMPACVTSAEGGLTQPERYRSAPLCNPRPSVRLDGTTYPTHRPRADRAHPQNRLSAPSAADVRPRRGAGRASPLRRLEPIVLVPSLSPLTATTGGVPMPALPRCPVSRRRPPRPTPPHRPRSSSVRVTDDWRREPQSSGRAADYSSRWRRIFDMPAASASPRR